MHHGSLLAPKILNWMYLLIDMMDFALKTKENEIQDLVSNASPVEALWAFETRPETRKWVEERYKKFNKTELTSLSVTTKKL